MSTQNFDLGELPATWVRHGSPASSRKAVAQMTPAEIGAEVERFRKDTRPATCGYVFKLMEAAIKRIEALESAQSLTLADSYKGTFLAHTTYKRGQALTHRGSLWLCMSDTQEVPGNGASWKLIVKCGKDGRDAQ